MLTTETFSDVACDLPPKAILDSVGFLFADRGDVALRGFEDPVRLYEVRWREEE